MEEYHKFNREYVTLNAPHQTIAQLIAASGWIITMAFGGLICSIFTIYLIFYTRFWWLTLLYLVWIFIDRKTCETGGRRSSWAQGWEFWAHFRNYFPIRLHRLPWTEYDPSKNYLFCCFPHGLLSNGVSSVFSTTYGEFSDYFPGLKPHLCILAQHFHTPFFRELMLALGGCSPSIKSLDYLLSKPKGGNAVGLIVGGAAEAYHCKPREYKLVLKNRKGFIKVALRNGCSLVPVISFGENDVFNQYDGGEGSLFKTFQEKLRKVIGLAPIIPIGRGVLHDSFSFVPHRRAINVIAGPPIAVEKSDDPKPSEIDDLHKRFCEELSKLFESQKHTYIKDADDIHLEFV